MFSLTFDLANLQDLNTFLASRSYVVGFAPSQTDVALFNALGKAPDAGKYPNVARFYSHIASFKAEAKAAFPVVLGAGAKAAAAPAKAAAAPAPAEEEDVDLFGDDADAAAAKVAAAAPKAPAPEKKKKEKVPEIAKTAVIYEVKPLEAGQDMKALEAAIRGIELDGLVWGVEFKVVDVAFGIQKLVIQCVIEDEKVGLADVEERIQAFEDQVQSIDMLSMSKVAGN